MVGISIHNPIWRKIWLNAALTQVLITIDFLALVGHTPTKSSWNQRLKFNKTSLVILSDGYSGEGIKTSCVRQHVTEETLAMQKTIKCPTCNFEFALTYSRAFACQGCPLSVSGCDYARCPRCDNEFKLHDLNITTNRVATRHMNKHVSKLLSDYYKEFGESARR